MSPSTLQRSVFISDIHLNEQRPELTHALLSFLSKLEHECDELYLLGDIFEAWLGDDAITPLAEQVMSALKQLQQSGCALFFVHGNRDFLIGEGFCEAVGATLLGDITNITLPNQQTATILHGDTLCTDDTDYLAFRQQVRNPQWQQMFLSKSVAERIAFAKQARAASAQKNQTTALDILDANEEAVCALFEQQQTQVMIHGHTHRPKLHEYPKTQCVRYVLSDWERSFQYLDCTPQGCELIKVAI